MECWFCESVSCRRLCSTQQGNISHHASENLSIHEKIEAVILSETTTQNLGYIEWHGYACSELVNKRKKVTEKQMVEIALLDTVDIFSFIQGQLEKLIRDKKGIFGTTILKGIQNAQSVKINKIKKPENFSKENIAGKLKDINNATVNCPYWYIQEAGNGHRKGNEILGEVDCIKVIISQYLTYLEDQDGRNKTLMKKRGGSHTYTSNRKFHIIENNKT